MTYEDTIAKLKAHLAKRGFGDIEVKPSGGYDPTTTRADSRLIHAQAAVYAHRHRAGAVAAARRLVAGIPVHRRAAQPAGRALRLGHGARAHAPDEYLLIDSQNPKVTGYRDAVNSYVDYLYQLA